jgi:hypothetical protein
MLFLTYVWVCVRACVGDKRLFWNCLYSRFYVIISHSADIIYFLFYF